MESEPAPQPPLRLPADCSISGIRAVYELIRKSLTHQRQLEIDCSHVDKADVTSVQLLLSAIQVADGGDRRRRDALPWPGRDNSASAPRHNLLTPTFRLPDRADMESMQPNKTSIIQCVIG